LRRLSRSLFGTDPFWLIFGNDFWRLDEGKENTCLRQLAVDLGRLHTARCTPAMLAFK
jgi:hypothetical protein